MQKVWELYAIAITIIEKICRNKCSHLTITDVIEECQDYIKKRLEKDSFQALKNYDPTKGAKESTYLYTLISSRLIDFFNSAKKEREISSESSITNKSYEESELPADVEDILERFTSQLSFEEQTLLQYRYNDELSYREIGAIFGMTHKQASSKIEKIQLKLRKKMKKAGLSFEVII
jgi:RNA polymerase sigma factor (sigma-70 family)